MKTDRWPRLAKDIVAATALMTRLPLPRLPEDTFARSAQTTWAYPLAGLAAGGIAALAGYAAMQFGLTASLAAGLALACLLILTGALHEDGLADVADGFWGGFTPSERLAIMKDSQIGSYGTLALVVTIGLRWLAYASLLQTSLAAIIAVAAASRAILPAVMYKMPNARKSGLSHQVGRPGLKQALVAMGLGTMLAVAFLGWLGLVAMVAAGLAAIAMGWLAQRKISGQTGDVLGATQQVAEVSALISLTALI